MPPHGPGMVGALHSHDPEFPDDDWNLYSHLDKEETTSFNSDEPSQTMNIFRPFVRKLEPEPTLSSDADEELLVSAVFSSPANIRKLMFIGGGLSSSNHPNKVKCYVNKDNLDFSSLDQFTPSQEFDLEVNELGHIEILTSVREFTGVYRLAFFFPSNHGSVDKTTLQYIGMQGEHTHYRREAVKDTVFEVLCNGQDLVEGEGIGEMGHDHSHSHAHDHDHSHGHDHGH